MLMSLNFHVEKYISLYFLGLYLEPTVFTDVEDGTMMAQEESFGPIMIISRFMDGWVIVVWILL